MKQGMVETFSYGRIDASKRGFDPSLWELSVNLISIKKEKKKVEK